MYTLLLHAIILHAEAAFFYTQKVATLFCSLVILEVSVLSWISKMTKDTSKMTKLRFELDSMASFSCK